MKKHLLLLLACLPCFVHAQSKVNTDSIFSVAIELGKRNLYPQAIAEAQKALNSDNRRGDIQVYIANVFSWNNQNDSALTYVQQAKLNGYQNDEYFSTWLNILFRSHQYEQLLTACEVATTNGYGNAEDLFKKKLIAFSELRRYDEGIQLARKNSHLLKRLNLEELYTDLLRNRNTNVLTAAASIDLFDVKAPEYLFSAGFGFKIKKTSLELRSSWANRFGLNDVQMEGDGYLPVFKRSYFYLNYGYGFGMRLFPHHRAGLEYFFPLMDKTEASFGGRFLKYANSDVTILTGHLERYAGNYWASLRPFLVYLSNSSSFTLLTDIRRYDGNGKNYWGMELGYGNSPDDRYALTHNGTFNALESYRIKMNRDFLFHSVSNIRIGLGYHLEEVLTGTYRNRYEIELIYKFRM